MILVSQKNVVLSLSLIFLASSLTHLNARDNSTESAVSGLAIGAGILGLFGLAAAGIAYAYSKSDEQLAQEAEEAVREAHRAGHRFYGDYVNVFMRPRPGSPTLEEIELYFLFGIALNSYYANSSVEDYIDTLANYVKALDYAFDQVADRMRTLEKNRETYTGIYKRLAAVAREISHENAYLKDYYQKFADHRAYFALYAYEAHLLKTYETEFELGRQYQNDPYLFEFYIMQTINGYNLSYDYPLIAYYDRLNNHIDNLRVYIQNLRYYYPGRTPAAQQLLDYMIYMRGVIANSANFRQEKRIKKEDDDRIEQRAIAERKSLAYEREVSIREFDARAREIERERNRLVWENKERQPHVIVINN